MFYPMNLLLLLICTHIWVVEQIKLCCPNCNLWRFCHRMAFFWGTDMPRIHLWCYFFNARSSSISSPRSWRAAHQICCIYLCCISCPGSYTDKYSRHWVVVVLGHPEQRQEQGNHPGYSTRTEWYRQINRVGFVGLSPSTAWPTDEPSTHERTRWRMLGTGPGFSDVSSSWWEVLSVPARWPYKATWRSLLLPWDLLWWYPTRYSPDMHLPPLTTDQKADTNVLKVDDCCYCCPCPVSYSRAR